MKDNKLEVGDVVYHIGWFGKIEKYVIERTTKTMAISGKIRIRINTCQIGNVVTVRFAGNNHLGYVNDESLENQ